MDCKKEVEDLIKFIRLKVNCAKKGSCIIGLSGGVDSAVIASLCKIAFPDNAHGISMPYKTLDSPSIDRAIELCEKKNIELSFHPVSFHGIMFNANLKKHEKKCNDKAIGNYLARQRMATLYMYAEMLNGLVIGTDNLSENYIGYFTKYGDGGVDINPIGRYFKSEVYELARYLEVPDSIINATPSAELCEGQTDECDFGFSYDDLEKYIKNDFKGISIETCNKISEMNETSRHKVDIPCEYERNY